MKVTQTGRESSINERLTIFVLGPSSKDPERSPVRELCSLNRSIYFRKQDDSYFRIGFTFQVSLSCN